MDKTIAERKQQNKFRRNITALVFATAVCLAILAWGFIQFSAQYRKKVEVETSAHMMEITNQISAYVEDNMNNNWTSAEALAAGLNLFGLNDEDDIQSLLEQTRKMGQVADVYIYTENGASYSSKNMSKNNDASSDLIYDARNEKRYLSITESSVSYTVPVYTDVTYRGSKIVATSIVQDMETLISNMDVSSFGNTASLFLTQENGTVIGQLQPKGSASIYNVYSVLNTGTAECINEPGFVMDGILPNDKTYSFLLNSDSGNQYIVAEMCMVGDNVLRLFYCVPESAANVNSNQFIKSITILTVGIIVAFLIIASSLFVILFVHQHKEMNKELDMRQHMIDLLIANTSNAFALLSINEDEPLYLSSNINKITDITSLRLIKTDTGFKIETEGNTNNENINLVNKQLETWDGISDYVSPYLLYKNKVGQPRYFIVRYYPTEKSDTFIFIASDVTQEQEREQQLKTALTMADGANQAKTRFLANMSHDIRTRMNAIINMTDFALESIDDKAAVTEYLNTTKDSAHHLLSLINNILDMTRIESGQEYIESATFDLNHCLSGVSKIIDSVCSQKNIQFFSEIEKIEPHQLIGDQLKLSQILINILNNAVKFTPANGTIRFVVTKLSAIQGDSVSIRFDVIDTGVGIAADHIKSIFEPFVREADADANQVEGNGLGLSICKSYVTAMNGHIFCTSELGKGSTFTVELPFKVSDSAVENTKGNTEKQQVHSTANMFAGKHALLCEDHPVNQKIAKKFLERLGFTVEVANDGEHGLAKFTASMPNTFDIIYMDIQMPVMNGYEAAKAIRASRHSQAETIPILAMTANVFADDIEKARAAGMNGHIGKPIVIEDLISATTVAFDEEK